MNEFVKLTLENYHELHWYKKQHNRDLKKGMKIEVTLSYNGLSSGLDCSFYTKDELMIQMKKEYEERIMNQTKTIKEFRSQCEKFELKLIERYKRWWKFW